MLSFVARRIGTAATAARDLPPSGHWSSAIAAPSRLSRSARTSVAASQKTTTLPPFTRAPAPQPERAHRAEPRVGRSADCFQAKAYAACVVMVRRTLEGTCADQKIKEKSLALSLKKLAADGYMDDTLAKWADALRIIGNKGAHYTGKPVAREDAEDALAFAEALLDHIYVLRHRFAQFLARIEN
jgi:hypothetical protein